MDYSDEKARPHRRPGRLRRRGAITVGAIAAAALGGAALTYAAIPDTNGIIHGCYQKDTTNAGAGSPLLIIDSAKGHCPGGYTALTWNQVGPPGQSGISHIYSGTNTNAELLASTWTTVATVHMAPGPEQIIATFPLTDVEDSSALTVTCRIRSGNDSSAAEQVAIMAPGFTQMTLIDDGTFALDTAVIECAYQNPGVTVWAGTVSWSATAANAISYY